MASKNSQPHWFPLDWSKKARPLLNPSPKHFVSRNIYDPSVLYDGKTHVMLFRGESAHEPPTNCVGRLGIGFSPNGKDFQCQGEPVLVPDSPYESHGLANPRLTLAGGVFLLTYAAFDGERYRLCLATSTNLRKWFRHGPLFPEFEAKGGEATSGTIFPQYTHDGKYIMYVGAEDLYMATSSDLIEWELKKKPVLKRSKCADFAAKSIDSGPSPFLTKDGIVVLLNGADRKNHGRVFAALFDGEDPSKCLAQLKTPCLEPEHDWEKFGYLPNVVRATGLSLIDGQFHIYYSGADRRIGMATAPVPKNYVPFLEEDSQESKTKEKPKEDKPKICGV
jgi:beta-1,2-mannosidase